MLVISAGFSFALLSGCGGDSDVLPPPPTQKKPVSPSNLSAVALTSDSIRLEWTDRSQNEEGFEVWESIGDNSSFNMLLTVNAGITSKTLTGKSPATKYYYKVAAYNQGEKSDFSNIVDVTTKDIPPRSPANLLGELKTSPNLYVNLSWSDSSHNEQGFRIQRKTGDAGVWSGAGDVTANTEMFTDNNGLEPDNTYIYRVIAYNTAGNSAPSNEVRVVSSATSVPTAPTISSVSAISTTSLLVKWTSTSTNHTGFTIERKLTAGSYSEVKSAGSGDTEWLDPNCTANTTYSYRMRAFNGMGQSVYSNELNGTTLEEGALEVPTGVSASAMSSSEVKVSWSYPTGKNLEKFTVQRKQSATGAWELHAEIPATATEDRTYLDITVVANTDYWYRLSASKDGKTSNWSNEANVRTPAESGVVPNAPSNLDAELGGAAINITWQDNSSNESNFILEYNQDGAAWIDLYSAGQDEASYVYNGAPSGTLIKFRVYAKNAAGNSTYSNEDSVKTPVGETINAPTNLDANYFVAGNKIILTWKDNSENEDEFKVETKTVANPNWWQLALTPRNSPVFTFQNPNPKTTYWFRVRAINGTGNSPFSNEDSVDVPEVYSAPFGIRAINWDENTVKISWNDNNADVDGFHLEEKVDFTGGWQALIQTAPNEKEYMRADVPRGVWLFYRVRSSRGAMAEYSNWSEICSLKTAVRTVLPPDNFLGGHTSLSEAWLSWEYEIDHPDLGFQVQRKVGKGGEYPEKEFVFGGARRLFNDQTISQGQDYMYRIRAFIGTDTSAWSRQEVYIGPPAPAEQLNIMDGTLTSHSCTLEWMDKSDNESFFEIQLKRSEDMSWRAFGRADADLTQFEITGLSPRTAYDFRVVAATELEGGSLVVAPPSNETHGSTMDRGGGEEINLCINGVDFTLVWIKRGQFIMGAPDSLDDPDSRPTERPRHNVSIDTSFWMCKVEVTQAQWKALMNNANPSANQDDALPVEQVKPSDIDNFILALRDQRSFGWRLPYEVEWEYACRAGAQTRYYWGFDSTGEDARENAYFNWNTGTTMAVGQKSPNNWGLHDMCGNVAEWCLDVWHGNYIGAPSTQEPWLQPARAEIVVRGGSFESQPNQLRSSARTFSDKPAGSIGFRLVKFRDDY